MNRIQIRPLKRAPSRRLVDGTSELLGPTASVTIFPALSRSRRRSGGLKPRPQRGCRSVAVRPERLVVLRPHSRRRLTLNPRTASASGAGLCRQLHPNSGLIGDRDCARRTRTVLISLGTVQIIGGDDMGCARSSGRDHMWPTFYFVGLSGLDGGRCGTAMHAATIAGANGSRPLRRRFWTAPHVR
jgi:hypothetical protein